MGARPVLLLTRNFPPLVGGMERLNFRMAEALAARVRLAVVGPRGASAFVIPGVSIEEVPSRPLWRFGLSMFSRVLRRARIWAPGLVIGGSGLVAPFVQLAASLTGARTALYVHGLDLVAPSRIYRLIWLPMIRRCDIALANSAHTRRLAIACGVLPDRVHVLNPGVELPAFDDLRAQGASWRSKRQLEGRRVALTVGRLTQRKGLVEFISNVLPGLVAEYPDLALVVIGADASDALSGGTASEAQRVRHAIERAGMQGHVHLLGGCDDVELSGAYAGADVHVFPVRELPGDIEGFGMVALEAAAHGLPTVAFSVGGVPDAVSDGTSGWLVAPGDYAGFKNAVLKALAPGARSEMTAGCRTFAADKDWTAFGGRLADFLGISDE